MKSSLLNTQKGCQCFQYTLLMFSMFGILFKDHILRNCLTNEFVHTKVLPCCTPYPGLMSILVINNARIHHLEVLRTILHSLTTQELE